jgi:membrane protease YdiL (CAAX protease family)
MSKVMVTIWRLCILISQILNYMALRNISPITLLGLVLAAAVAPLIISYYAYAFPGELTNWIVISRELLIFLAAAALILLILKGEKRSLSSIGLHNKHWGKSVLWGFLLMVVSIIAGLGCLLALNALGISFGQGGEAQRYDQISLWAISLMVLRAGVVEELFYRGYIMERLEEISGRWLVYFLLPAIIFGLLHFRQGVGGILISFVLGLILAWFYWKKRDLKANIIAHFLVDFIPNVLVPVVEQQLA